MAKLWRVVSAHCFVFSLPSHRAASSVVGPFLRPSSAFRRSVRPFLRSIFRYDERCFRTRSHPCEQASGLQGVPNALFGSWSDGGIAVRRVQKAFPCKSPNPRVEPFWATVHAASEICGLRPAAMRWGQHTQRGEAERRQRERGKAKYPSILGGRETRSRDKGGVASGRIGSYA